MAVVVLGTDAHEVCEMGKHAKMEPGQNVTSVFMPISRGGLSRQLPGHDWRKDLVMSWLFQTSIRAANVTRHPIPEIWDDRPGSPRPSSLR